MEKTTSAHPHFTQPVRQLLVMLIVTALVGTGIALAYAQLLGLFMAKPWLNGFIALVFLLGVGICFLHVFRLMRSIDWLEDFVRQRPGQGIAPAPNLLAPLAALLRSRGARMQLSSTSSRSILDSVATRLDEQRDVTHYLGSLLIFLGLLGTFYGLATTVPALVETIRSLSPKDGETGVDVFAKLMGGLEDQLGGMGTAFSSSLLGLAGSLVVGLLELFAGHGQNRFYRELEEWLSTITKLGYAGPDGEATDQGAIAGILEQMAGQMDTMQLLHAQSEANRTLVDERIGALAMAVERLAGQLESGSSGQTSALDRLADGQERLIAALGSAEHAALSDAESRMRLRSIDVQLLRILEEIAAGRQEAVSDVRSDLAALTGAVRQLSRGAVGRR
ncbi:biopolymer transporter ExbB [Cereibacter changlensis]|uniref:Biopolymer transporter ExbB n=1 Tax=Cereibacter changlensis TaxID=402884 RepID=A0A4U0YVA7_9RHOB|nr:biopolymer transporter ExbB [Cereibacter changlensis]TKA94446.1 biopolymer transporter ExbB [Cereibacter changlensis]